MGFKVVKPGEESLSIAKQETEALPILPRDEAHRVRRASRNAMDALLPWAIREMVELARTTENEDLKFKILDKIVSKSLGSKSNDEVDPEDPMVNGKVVDADLEALERSTENG